MEDIVEERGIVKLCGYPLCDNPLTKIINKRYSISTLKNKVYDIEKTKNYCSHKCYLSTEYLMKQMLTSPLWLRDEELDVKPEFKIFENKKKRGTSPPGVEVKLVKLDLPDDTDESETSDESSKKNNLDKIEQKSTKRSFDPPVDDEINKNVENDDNKKENIKDSNNCGSKKLKKTVSFGKNEVREFDSVKMNVGNEQDSFSSDEDRDNDDSWIEFNEDADLTESMEKMIIDDENKEDNEEIIDLNKAKKEELPVKNNNSSIKNLETVKKNKKSKRQEEKTFEALVANVEKCVTEWITEDTSSLLHVESSKIKIVEKLKREEILKVLCKKLDMTKIEEERENRMESIKSSSTRPVPDFSTLQEESKNLELKVKAFYQGNIEIDKKNKQDKEIIEADDAIIPLTDAHDATAIRRRIFMDKLNRVVPDLLKTLAGSDYHNCVYTPERVTNIKALVHTFKLSASNIIFKSIEWTLVALLIIKM